LGWVNARVVGVADVTPTVREIKLRPEIEARPFSPGSHVEVDLEAGSGRIKRCYSLVGVSGEAHYRIGVKRSPQSRGGSLGMFRLNEGDTLRISEPRNSFKLSLDRPDYLLIAGGIGITPIIGMAIVLRKRKARTRLVYAAQSVEELAFAADLDKHLEGDWKRAITSAGTRLDLHHALSSVLPDGEVYICGPARLLKSAREVWRELARPAENLRFETFATSGTSEPRPFTVNLPHLGVSVTVQENESIVDALCRSNIDVLFDCLRGECGLCALPVLALDGEIDHRDVFLSEAERKEARLICACVSRIVGNSISLDSGYRTEHVME
jgi:ferredoxin-NADP reductase